MTAPEDYLAGSEDGDVVWYRRSDCTRSQARYLAACIGTWYGPEGDWWKARVFARYMRPEEPGYYHIECSRDEPGAIPVWRVES